MLQIFYCAIIFPAHTTLGCCPFERPLLLVEFVVPDPEKKKVQKRGLLCPDHFVLPFFLFGWTMDVKAVLIYEEKKTDGTIKEIIRRTTTTLKCHAFHCSCLKNTYTCSQE